MSMFSLFPHGRIWGIFLFLALIAGGAFVVFSRLGGVGVSEWENSYWGPDGQFIFSGGYISSLEGSGEFFTGARIISEIRSSINQMDPSLPEKRGLLHFLEYPCCSVKDAAQNIQMWFDAEIKDAERILSEGLVNTGPTDGYPTLVASFHLTASQYLGSVIYTVDRDLLTLGSEQWKRVFIINDQGKEVDKKTLLRVDTEEKKRAFADFILGSVRTQHPENTAYADDDEFLMHSLDTFFADPEFAFSGDTVVFFFAPGILGPYASGVITVEVPYVDVAEWVLSIPPVPQSKRSVTEGVKSVDGKQYVALTFDDGPSSKTTPRLLDILKEKDVKATFYVLGTQAERFPEIVKRTYDEGHEIGNHSWDHKSFTQISLKAVAEQVRSTNQAVKKIIGETPKTMRPPYGAYNKAVREVVGMPMVMWSVDTLDWKHRNAKKGVELALQQTTDGAIILFHDIHAQSVDAIPPLIDELRRRGYEFVTVSELYEKYHHTQMPASQVCFSIVNCR